jgi:flagellar motor switch protein FliN/FliY
MNPENYEQGASSHEADAEFSQDAEQLEGSPRPAVFREADGLGFVMDVPVRLTVEIGRKTMRIGEILRMGPGSILELNKANGEPLDVYANDRLIARGEAVVVGERYGVRLTEVLVNDGAADVEDLL